MKKEELTAAEQYCQDHEFVRNEYGAFIYKAGPSSFNVPAILEDYCEELTEQLREKNIELLSLSQQIEELRHDVDVHRDESLRLRQELASEKGAASVLREENDRLKGVVEDAINRLEWHIDDNPSQFGRFDYEMLNEFKSLLTEPQEGGNQ